MEGVGKQRCLQSGWPSFVNVGKQGLPEISLSKIRPNVGGTVIQLAFDLASNQLGVILGRIIEAKPMLFNLFDGKTAEAPGLLVVLAADERQLQGTGGAP